jgi:hypothetical protein
VEVCKQNTIENSTTKEQGPTIGAVVFGTLSAVWFVVIIVAFWVWEWFVAALALVGLLDLAGRALAFFASTVVDHATELACWGLWVVLSGQTRDGHSGDEAESE